MKVYYLGNDPIQACGVTLPSSSTSSAASPTATLAALCPSSNNTIYTEATGQMHNTYCGYDYDGSVLDVEDLASYELCLQKCDTLDTCGAMAWTGGDGRGFCYLKEANTGLVRNANVRAGIRIPTVTSAFSLVASSASVLSSSSSSSSSALTSSTLSTSSSSSSRITMTASPFVNTPNITKGLICPNPTPTAMVFGDNVYEYEWCLILDYELNFVAGDLPHCIILRPVFELHDEMDMT
ncbi:hypothetical protein BU25DRAFT_455078 [Macroventuria anomochaeta]|uniref:Uncharacterized protein n=1 Tax=Macroventuria anomochaeta TaxID=301207 RepID=A0ACB6SEF9_9PLEO|nr:uncharacterized protein BU25DRAFT_455078 [Macroventuria anomochaeta]KAF2631644.1 hypothetical protein BU25DRAFT_455078 [Macroventuria anomochaeta]